jgi:LysM repeat protein
VQWGDTLTKIAQKSGVTTQAIIAANPGLNPNYIVPGQTLVIPAPGGTGVPGPTAGPVPAQPPPAACTPTYTVQRGDWFYAIARRFSVGVPALMQANPSINANVVYPGQVLNIPCGGTSPAPPGGGPVPSGNSYVVRPGDTLFSIAMRSGTTVYAIQIANNLPNPHFIYVGQVLSIPR